VDGDDSGNWLVLVERKPFIPEDFGNPEGFGSKA
jgi:hypothetical protein